ncbi:hypothetical protein IMG5_177940 [Ichthyophthirius multifiliis]|uniref:Uncharacterized protein n=1 Tax=Ichthyophthirius multifiliis TaxID=5932 RepID=G0R2G6_ICHMU|nr:hypothetical protein IMG5_177940 [Ichthyophthirius multifiliis]EGR28334.1 hypothetical protein IMG5_177940 [Ichthyophthirius multifiliis]|eukprot:XP_004027679.1 hypothetical protein IMG5_177940 [Ichthyophthirius multifiliis]
MGNEYAEMLLNKEKYCSLYNFETFSQKTHPQNIYMEPQNGQIYYVEGNCIGSQFGFPRINIKKNIDGKK